MTGVTSVAEEYLEVREQARSSETNKVELLDERDKWKSKLDELEEDDPLYDVAEKNYEEADEQLQQEEHAEERLNKLKDDLLEIASNKFIPSGEWLDPKVLRALNLAVLCQDRDYIEVHETRIEEGTEVDNDEELFDIAMAVRAVIIEERGASDSLAEFWDGFQELERYELFQEVVAAAEPVTGKDIAMRRNEEDRRQAISQTLIDTTHGEVNPYFKQGQGEYSLSFIGEYLVQNFDESGDSLEDVAEEADATLNSY